MEVGKTIKYRTYYFLFVSLIMLIMEIVMYLIIFQSMPRYFILDICTIFLLALPIMIWYHKLGAFIYGSIVFTLHLAIFIGNLSLYHASSDFISISYLNVLKEAGSVFSWSFLSIWFVLLAVFFLASYIFGLVMFVKKTPKGNNYLIKYGLYFSTIMLLILIPSKEITYNTIENNNVITTLDGYSGGEIISYCSILFKRSAIRKYGFYSFYIGEIEDALIDKTELIKDYFTENDVSYSEVNDLTSSGKKYNVLEIMIETGIPEIVNETLTPTIYSLQQEGINFVNNYSKNKTNSSEFIGINGSMPSAITPSGYNNQPFSLPNVLNKFGYNTSYFHCNSYDFYQRGRYIPQFGFKNCYFDDRVYKNGKVLYDEDGDELMSPAYDLYWPRTTFMSGNYPLDSDFVYRMKNYMVPEKSSTPFYSYFISLCTHGPYDQDQEMLNKKYANLECCTAEKGDVTYLSSITGEKVNKRYIDGVDVTDNTYLEIVNEAEEKGLWHNPIKDSQSVITNNDQIAYNQYKMYQCDMMVFDDALAMLIDRLKQTGQYDNTILLLYGDHEPYYSTNSIKEELSFYIHHNTDLFDGNPEYFIPTYSTIMTISNPTINQKYYELNNSHEYTEFTSPYIVVPTLLDLLGIKFDRRYYIYDSAFSSNYINTNIFYSNELKFFFNDYYLADDLDTDPLYVVENDIMTFEDFIKKANKVIHKISIFNAIYDDEFLSKNRNKEAYNEVLDSYHY